MEKMEGGTFQDRSADGKRGGGYSSLSVENIYEKGDIGDCPAVNCVRFA